MPIHVELINPHAVLQTYSDPLDSTQLNALRYKMEEDILPAAPGKLHIIADFRTVRNLPEMILTNGSVMLRTAHPNTGIIICVTTSAFIQTMAGVLNAITYTQPLKIAASIEEACAELNLLLANNA